MTDFLSGSTFTDRYVPYRSGWDGQELSLSSQGESVAVMQQYLNEIAQAYPAIPAVKEDGIFGVKTLNSLLLFQHFFQLLFMRLLPAKELDAPDNGSTEYAQRSNE